MKTMIKSNNIFLLFLALIIIDQIGPSIGVINGLTEAGISPVANLQSAFIPSYYTDPFAQSSIYGQERVQIAPSRKEMAKYKKEGYTEEEVWEAYNLARYSNVSPNDALKDLKKIKKENEEKKGENLDGTKSVAKKQIKEEKGGASEIDFTLKNLSKELKTVPAFAILVEEAKEIIVREKTTFDSVLTNIKSALGERKLVSIRLVGIGSMVYHEKHYDYKITAQQFNQLPPGKKGQISTLFQSRNVIQNAFCIMLVEHFKMDNEELKATSEDLFLTNPVEKRFLKNNGIVTVPSKKDPNEKVNALDGEAANLKKLPKKVITIPQNDAEATLVITFAGTVEMTLNLLSAYNGLMKRVILVEAQLENAYKFYSKGSPQYNFLKPLKKDFTSAAAFPATKMSKDFFDGPDTVIRTTKRKGILDEYGERIGPQRRSTARQFKRK